MKKTVLFFTTAMLLSMGLWSCGKDSDNRSSSTGGNSGGDNPGTSTVEWVDLGLSSGTIWKTTNEGPENPSHSSDFYSYYRATTEFGDSLPSREQYEELVNECDWSWTGEGYSVVGPNGDSIYFPAAGSYDVHGGHYTGEGFYWSSTPEGDEFSWALRFGRTFHHVAWYYYICYGSVRLVQNP